MIVQTAIDGQASVYALRLVSRAFHQAADPHFFVYMHDAPFEKWRTLDYRREYKEIIRVCGRYIRLMDLRSGPYIDEDLMELIRDCCPNVEKVTFSFQEYCGKVPDYHSLLKKWSPSTNPNSDNIGYRNKIKKVTALIDMSGEESAIGNFEKGLDSIREYLTGMTKLIVKVESTRFNISGDPNLKPLSWQTFEGFFHSFPSLTSFSVECLCIRWSQMPPAETITSSERRLNEKEINFPNLTKLTLDGAELDLSIIRRLNLIFPRLEVLKISHLVSSYGGDSGTGGQGEVGEASSLLIPRAITSVNLTLRRMRVHEANAYNVHELLRLAPTLKHFTCDILHTQNAQGNLVESRKDVLTILKPFKDRHWDVLGIYQLDSRRMPG
ncbi:hypothetical protein BGZ80_010074, partial [Entomortierella chlamydospora]